LGSLASIAGPPCPCSFRARRRRASVSAWPATLAFRGRSRFRNPRHSAAPAGARECRAPSHVPPVRQAALRRGCASRRNGLQPRARRVADQQDSDSARRPRGFFRRVSPPVRIELIDRVDDADTASPRPPRSSPRNRDGLARSSSRLVDQVGPARPLSFACVSQPRKQAPPCAPDCGRALRPAGWRSSASVSRRAWGRAPGGQRIARGPRHEARHAIGRAVALCRHAPPPPPVPPPDPGQASGYGHSCRPEIAARPPPLAVAELRPRSPLRNPFTGPPTAACRLFLRDSCGGRPTRRGAAERSGRRSASPHFALHGCSRSALAIRSARTLRPRRKAEPLADSRRAGP